MSYSIIGSVLLLIGLVIIVFRANMELTIVQEADRTKTDALDYMQKIESSNYAFSIALMVIGGVVMFVGAFSIAKHRSGNNNS